MAAGRPGLLTAMRLCALLCCRPAPSPLPAIICPVKLISASPLTFDNPILLNGNVPWLNHKLVLRTRFCLAWKSSPQTGDVGNREVLGQSVGWPVGYRLVEYLQVS